MGSWSLPARWIRWSECGTSGRVSSSRGSKGIKTAFTGESGPYTPVCQDRQAWLTPCASVAFSPDGKCLVSGSLDRTLRVWDLQGTKRAVEVGSKDNVEKGLGTCQSTLNGHKVGRGRRP